MFTIFSGEGRCRNLRDWDEQRILFITFSSEKDIQGHTGKYGEIYKAGERLVHQAISTGVFSHHVHLHWDDLVRLSDKYGLPRPNTALQYLFTPYLVNVALKGEFGRFNFIFYAGAGCEIVSNKFAVNDLKRILRIAKQEGMYLEGTRYLEASWSKKELVERLNPNERIMESGQVMATFLVISACNETLPRVCQIMSDWLEAAIDDNFAYINDEFDKEIQDARFISHRNDQSILSIVTKSSGIKIQRETRRGFSKPFVALRGASTFIWLSRNRTGVSQLPKHINTPIMGFLSLIFSPIFSIHSWAQDSFSMRIQYRGFPKNTIVKTSTYSS